MGVWKQTYTVRELAIILAVSEDTIIRLLEEGLIPSFRVGKQYRVSIKAFHEQYPDLPQKLTPHQTF